MGRRGPKPLPSAIKQARGTFRADRAAANEAASIGRPKMPKWLTDTDARREFRRVSRVLTAMGLVGRADSNLIARYAVTSVRWRRVIQTLMANPGAEVAVYRDANGQPKSVQVSALNSNARSLGDELSRAEQQLGMNPSARSRIEVSIPIPAPADPAADFFDGRMN